MIAKRYKPLVDACEAAAETFRRATRNHEAGYGTIVRVDSTIPTQSYNLTGRQLKRILKALKDLKEGQ